MLTKKQLNDLTYEVIGAAIEVHKHLGPGLLEGVYHRCMKEELFSKGIQFKSEMYVPVQYKDITLDADLKCDFFSENCLVTEIKSLQILPPVFEAQVLTYMKLLEAPKGILINFFVLIYSRKA